MKKRLPFFGQPLFQQKYVVKTVYIIPVCKSGIGIKFPVSIFNIQKSQNSIYFIAQLMDGLSNKYFTMALCNGKAV